MNKDQLIDFLNDLLVKRFLIHFVPGSVFSLGFAQLFSFNVRDGLLGLLIFTAFSWTFGLLLGLLLFKQSSQQVSTSNFAHACHLLIAKTALSVCIIGTLLTLDAIQLDLVSRQTLAQLRNHLFGLLFSFPTLLGPVLSFFIWLNFRKRLQVNGSL